MKQPSFIVGIVSLFAVAVLYFLHFSDSGNAVNEKVEEEVSSVSNAGALNIAYVKADSVLLNYNLAQDMHDDFSRKQEAYNNEYSSKRKSFEREAAAFQEKLQRGGFLTEQRAVQERDRLMGREQEIVKLDQELSSKLAELQAANNQRILDSLLNYLNEYNKKKNFDYIFNGAEILVGDEASNITLEVLKVLNERYSKAGTD